MFRTSKNLIRFPVSFICTETSFPWFWRVRNQTFCKSASVTTQCLSACPYVTNSEPLSAFSCNFILEVLLKFFRQILVLIQTRQQTWHCTLRHTCVSRDIIHRIFKKIVEEQNIILFSYFLSLRLTGFFRKLNTGNRMRLNCWPIHTLRYHHWLHDYLENNNSFVVSAFMDCIIDFNYFRGAESFFES
jgi:hypothetical protein